jgi:archaellum biogenesis ATPase FlaH
MDFMKKRREMLGVESLGELIKSGKVNRETNKEKFVHGPEEFDCLTRKWSRGDILNLLGASGVGKSEVSLQFLKGILENNPNGIVTYISLEMQIDEVAQRWHKITQGDEELANRLYIIPAYDLDGSVKKVDVDYIKRYMENIKYASDKDLLAFVLDHFNIFDIFCGAIGVNQLNQLVQDIKSIAIEQQCFGIVLSQVPKGPAQSGDIPIEAHEAFGTSSLKNFSHFVMQIHKPLLKVEEQAKMNIMAWSYVKIRESDDNDKVKLKGNNLLAYDLKSRDFRPLTINEDARFRMFYDSVLEMREAEDKKKSYAYNMVKRIKNKEGRDIEIRDTFVGSSEEL